jgi:protoheme IX farnesyltransferase
MRQAQSGASFLQRLRVYHAPLAGSIGLYLLLIAGLTRHLRPDSAVSRAAGYVNTLFFAQIGVGFLNVTLLAPVWVQVIHLIMANLVWISFSLLAITACAEGVPQLERQAMNTAVPDTTRPGIRDYYQITKPRVISLLLFTTLAALFIAQDATHRVSVWLFVAVFIGGYMSAGAANVFNMVIDRDIDHRMTRTSTRATVTQKISANNAILYGLALMFGSFVLLTVASNMLAALLALAGLVYYVIVYTLYLKRRHWQNIVIGGAAGAFPPLVGWAAVQGDLKSWMAWYLFTIIFLWTPAHFWALALLLRDDYAEAGVPMLPVVHGERVTVWHIAFYAILTVVFSLLPLVQHLVGYGYVAAALVLDGILLAQCVNLFRRTDRPRASKLFHYSMVYLALLFLAMAVENVVRT